MEGITLLIAIVALILGISAYGQKKKTRNEIERAQMKIDAMEKRITELC